MPVVAGAPSLVESGGYFYKYCSWSGGLFYPLIFGLPDGADAYPAYKITFSSPTLPALLMHPGTRLITSSPSATLRVTVVPAAMVPL